MSSTRLEIHQSTLSLLSKCGMMAYWVYVEGLRLPPDIGRHVGTVTHAAIRENLRRKQAHGELYQASEVADLAASESERLWHREPPELTAEEREKGVGAVRDKAKDQAIGLALAHHAEVAPALQPSHVEHRVLLRVKDFPADLVGTIDVAELRPSPSGTLTGGIRDTKTAAKAYSEGAVDCSPQLDFYAMLARFGIGAEVETVGFDVLVKKAKPEVQRLTGPAPRDFTPLTRRIQRAVRVFESGAFVPVDPSGPSGWVCSERWCGFWKDKCEYGRRARKSYQVSKGQE